MEGGKEEYLDGSIFESHHEKSHVRGEGSTGGHRIMFDGAVHRLEGTKIGGGCLIIRSMGFGGESGKAASMTGGDR